MQALIAGLKDGSKQESQCLVVILDEFDLFAHGQKQTFLYTILDTVQHAATPLGIPFFLFLLQFLRRIQNASVS